MPIPCLAGVVLPRSTLADWLGRCGVASFLDDGSVPIDNNWVENQIRLWALSRSNWLFAGSLRSGQRETNMMSLIQSVPINSLDPQA
jgi:hypothetical protein